MGCIIDKKNDITTISCGVDTYPENEIGGMEFTRWSFNNPMTLYKGFLDELELINLELLDWHLGDEPEIEEYGDSNEYLTFDEIYKQCVEIFEEQHLTLTIFITTPLSGVIYTIGNYSDIGWYKIGTTRGYA